jgi:hypothetical protein
VGGWVREREREGERERELESLKKQLGKIILE